MPDIRQADGYFLPRLALNLQKTAISLALVTVVHEIIIKI